MLITVHTGSPYTINIGQANLNTFDVNLRQRFLSEYPNVLTAAVVTFLVSGNIGSTDRLVPALTTGAGWPEGSKLTLVTPDVLNFSGPDGENSPLNGLIAGKGGRGGPDFPLNPVVNRVPSSTSGEPGGPAILLEYNLNIVNNGIIGGGGQGSNFISYPGGVATKTGFGGAGLNPGQGTNGGLATYRIAQGPASGGNRGGNLGQAAHGVDNPKNAPWIVLNNFQYALSGSGQVFGGEAPSVSVNVWGTTPQAG